MKLDVIAAPAPWYGDGLKFTCTQCGNCCTGPPGFVWISRDEIAVLAGQLKLTVEETIEQYCRPMGDRYALREVRNSRGEYDCVFLQDHGGGRRTCGVYTARPTQCRTWPFWPGNLASQQAWDTAAVRCHGMNRGRDFTLEEISALKDAQDRT